MRARAVAVDSDFPEKRDLEQQMEQLSSRSTHEQADSPMGTALTSVLPGFKFLHATAVVHPDAVLGEGVVISAFCTVGPGVTLGNGCKLHAGSHICGNTTLGDHCEVLKWAFLEIGISDLFYGDLDCWHFLYCLLYLLSFISCSCLPYWLTREEWVGLHVVWLILLDSGAVVGSDIPGCTVIGHRNTIGYNAVVGVKCQDMKYKEGDECSLYIGNNNDIREYVSIHRSSKPNDDTVSSTLK
jgi:NDP-sugar pyrophosphorylase family protein